MAIVTLKPPRGIFGLPPTTWISDDMIMNSMPVVEFIPGKPHFQSGQNLFEVLPDYDAYNNILAVHNYELSSPRSIKFAFLADNFPTDTFSNDYGDTFLQKMTDIASSGVQDIIQITGSTKATEGAKKLLGELKGAAGEGYIGKGIQKASGAGIDIIQGLDDAVQRMAKGGGGQTFMGQSADMINKLLGGHRVDFPSVWRNSGFSPSYTMTIRLYNPQPGRWQSTQEHIIGPLAVILLLGLPRSEDGLNYSWPFFHRITAPGIYELDPGVITNITVIKGGDQQQIGYNQALAMVDVRIDVTSIYNSIIAEESGDRPWQNRPTLREYLFSMHTTTEYDKEGFTRRGQLRKNAAFRTNTNFDQSDTPGSASVEDRLFSRNDVANTVRAKTPSLPVTEEPSDPPPSRTSNKDVEDTLVEESDPNLVASFDDVFGNFGVGA